ncbi:MAG: response regulator [Chloroflexi bacterium]|nr:response regulator [Chloroflexota bacterium]MBU1752177.1 response regulator [Chloroflexota bacterium]
MKGNIMVVDDTPANLRLLSDMLVEQGYKVRSVINGQMALTATRAAPPDLILLDINMPDMNGYEVCEHLKGDEQTCDIPIIFISALGEVEDKVRAFAIGGVDYIPKPFQLEEVLARVQTHLSLRQLQEELLRANEELEQRVAERTAELVQLNTALERFVPREFLGFLSKTSIAEVRLGDQVQAEMTILFSDMRDFTPRSERLTPSESFAFVNEYLGRVGPIIRQHQGFIDKYLGDGVMALFPGADDAVQSAIAMQCEVACYNAYLQERGAQPIAIGVGLHTGRTMLGIIGEEERIQGTVIADAVNMADRLENLTKVYGVSIVVSEETLARLQDPGRVCFRFLDRAQVKGKRELVPVFEILDGDPATMELKLQTRPAFEEGLHLYYERKFAEASVRFNQVLEQNTDDKAARLYLQRAARFMVQGVPPDWDGAGTLGESAWHAPHQV